MEAYYIKYQNDFFIKISYRFGKFMIDGDIYPYIASLFPNKPVAELKLKKILEMKETEEFVSFFGNDFKDEDLTIQTVTF